MLPRSFLISSRFASKGLLRMLIMKKIALKISGKEVLKAGNLNDALSSFAGA